MKTNRPISSIHYCFNDQLKGSLDELIQRNIISFYCFIRHLPESDEKGKEHIHFFIIPNGRIDTDQLRNEIEYIDIDNIKPIRCLPFNNSKFGDWYLYALHDSAYLASKGQTREFNYKDSEIITSDNNYLIELIHLCDFSKINTQKRFIEMVNNGDKFSDIVKTGIVPVPLINQYEKLYQLIYNHSLNRNLGLNHETGELTDD